MFRSGRHCCTTCTWLRSPNTIGCCRWEVSRAFEGVPCFWGCSGPFRSNDANSCWSVVLGHVLTRSSFCIVVLFFWIQCPLRSNRLLLYFWNPMINTIKSNAAFVFGIQWSTRSNQLLHLLFFNLMSITIKLNAPFLFLNPMINTIESNAPFAGPCTYEKPRQRNMPGVEGSPG